MKSLEDSAREAGSNEDAAGAATPAGVAPVMLGGTLVALALTENFEAMPAAIAAVASAYLILRGA